MIFTVLLLVAASILASNVQNYRESSLCQAWAASDQNIDCGNLTVATVSRQSLTNSSFSDRLFLLFLFFFLSFCLPFFLSSLFCFILCVIHLYPPSIVLFISCLFLSFLFHFFSFFLRRFTIAYVLSYFTSYFLGSINVSFLLF